MDAVQKNCDVKKASLDTAIGDALKFLGEDPHSIRNLQGSLKRITRCEERYLEASDSLLDKMLKANTQEAQITKEELDQSTLFTKAEMIITDVREAIRALQQTTKEDDEASVSSGLRSGAHHRLPKLELPKFGGEARDWLAFWSAFQTVHEDDAITLSVKFQYLTNCMISGSVAQEIVSSYPSTPENYKEAIRSLEERFGRSDMLVEVYVRDLIGLILENAQSKSSTPFSSLYVRLSTQLRALGSLGVTTEKCAAILLPMVESTLPEDILVAWERNRP